MKLPVASTRETDALWSRVAGVEIWAFWSLLVLSIGVIVVAGPVLTSDGPAHVSMAHFMLVAGDPSAPALNRVYEMNPSLTPNALGHFLLAGFMLILSPAGAEQAMQILCVASVVLAARLTLHRLGPDAGWLALFFFPVAFQRLFFLGLYNFSLSLTGFLLCIWAYLGVRKAISATNAGILAVCLLVTLACQASGWIAAAVAIATMTLVDCCLTLASGERLSKILRLPVILLVCALPGLILLVLFALQRGGDRHIAYAVPVLARLLELLRGDAFGTIGPLTSRFGCLLGIVLITLLTAAIVEARRTTAADQSARRLRASLCGLPVAFVVVMLIVPDEAGGGWSHFLRAVVFPYIGLTLGCAAFPHRRTLRVAAALIATCGGIVAIGSTAWLQLFQVPPVVREFDEADRFIGPHCTVAPVLSQFKLDPKNTAQLVHHPLFHLANRFEMRSDRVVLFSYNARLPVYPVRFKHDADPQRLLYGWKTAQRDTHVTKIDPEGYEAATGIVVDYVLLWDIPPAGSPGPYRDIRAVSLAHYILVHRSAGGRLELYRRLGSDGCAKP